MRFRYYILVTIAAYLGVVAYHIFSGGLDEHPSIGVIHVPMTKSEYSNADLLVSMIHSMYEYNPELKFDTFEVDFHITDKEPLVFEAYLSVPRTPGSAYIQVEYFESEGLARVEFFHSPDFILPLAVTVKPTGQSPGRVH